MIRGSRLGLVFAAAALIISACSLPVDEEATVIPQDQLPDVLRSDLSTTTTTTLAPSVVAVTVSIYLLDVVAQRSVVVATTREVEQSASFKDRISLLFGTEIRTETEKEQGWSNALREFELLDASINDGVAVIDMVALDASGSPITVEARLLADAAAQLVYTSTTLSNINGVRVLIDGQTAFLPTSGGDTKQIVTTADFKRYDPAYVPPTTTTTTQPPTTTSLPPVSNEAG